MNEGYTKTDYNQDYQLNKLLKDEIECTVITTNGVQMRGKIQLYDKFSVLLRTHNGIQNLIYKHAISTIRLDR
ncbi:RNA chaperone Hfq [Paenibacillus kribbensis]|uniref:RNA chaperone Hfq n=1 Tax=Paenibacillus TaxID=44249 RepID=UPI0005C4A07A|nr:MULTISPECIES: RNA chaperone Hfq [Paenibacillus]MEC0237170.1 RNA chaperone Hfq [Paenibacillus kribbensis]